MIIELENAVKLLSEFDNVLILVHHFPDGDTLGCGYALCKALQSLGKKARVECSDKIPDRYDYITKAVLCQDFEPEHIVAVDVADNKLLGTLNEKYGDKVELCIDHHASNTMYAANTYVDSAAAAACEIIYQVVLALGVSFDKDIANALYTGIATDTGCFKFTNTTVRTHTIAAELMKLGADYGEINRIMFDTKSKSRLAIERMVLENIMFSHSDKIALVTISQQMISESGAEEGELEGITSLPRTVEGVIIGITLRERKDGKYKVSVRTHAPISACELCLQFGGGGHDRAGGCEIADTLCNARDMMLSAAEQMLSDCGL
ncbi:MAG: bifunctional oligoribonuclease/PAP phosphatase NrnA [Acutalibacteraceae bacterium]